MAYEKLTDIPLDKLIADFEAIEYSDIQGCVQVSNLNKEKRTFKLSLIYSNGDKDGEELPIIVDILRDNAYIDENETPKITPQSYLQVLDIFAKYELQPPRHSRPE